MQNNIVVNVFEVRKGKNDNWLKFTITVGGVNNNMRFDVDFCGTELHGTPLYGEIQDVIRKEFIYDYNYPPYDIRKCKEILKQKDNYTIELQSNGE
jgi:hypothetical protein